MAFTDSIKWNGKSIRDFFLEITNVSGRGKPSVEVRSVSIPGRHGQIAFKQTYKPRIIEIEGTIEGVSHATLMSNIENLKSLFAMEDEMLSPGEESITDSFKYGKLEFGDESDRHYNAVFDSVFEVPDISHQWMSNEMKHFRARFRCDEPFAISNSITEATMAGSADEFKVFSTGNVQSKPIIELIGAVTNPMLIEGDKVGVAHFDYNDNLSDVTLSTVSGNFSNIFGYRSVKSFSSQQSKAIQLVNKDNLYLDRGANINGHNYANFNPHQGTIVMWVKPYWDGDDGVSHQLFRQEFNGSNYVAIDKGTTNKLFVRVFHNGVGTSVNRDLTSANFGAGEWHLVVARWDINNTFDGTNYIGLRLDTADSESSIQPGAVQGLDATLSFGQSIANDGSNIFDGLMHWQIFERALTDSEVADLYNLGAGMEPFVTPDTKLLSAGELSSGDPVSVQYPWVDNKFGGNDGSMEGNPASEWQVSGTVSLTNESTIVKYDVQSIKLGYSAAPDYGFLNTDVLVNDQDYFYRLWINITSLTGTDEIHLDIVGNSTVLTRKLIDASPSGNDDLGVAKATSTWLYFEGTFEADGAVAHEFRIRKLNGTANATLYIDQMDCQVSKVNNSPFEGTYTVIGSAIVTSSMNTTFTASGVTDASAWDLSTAKVGMIAKASGGSKGRITVVNNGGDVVSVASWDSGTPVNGESVEILNAKAPSWTWTTINSYVYEETANIHSGTSAQVLNTNHPGGSTAGITRSGADTYIADTWVLLSVWIRGDAGGETFTLQFDNFTGISDVVSNTFTATTSWTKYYFMAKLSSDATGQIRINLTSNNSIIFVDDVATIELDTVTANAASKATPEIESYSQERFGQGLQVDGGDTLSWSLIANKNEGAVVCWLKPQFGAAWADETDDPVIFELYFDTNNYLRLSYDWTNDKFIFRKRAGGTDYDAEAPNQTFNRGDLLSVIGTYGSNGVRIYINGVLGSVIDSNASLLSGNPGTLYLSDNTQSQFPDAIVDEIYLFSRELSADEALKYSNQNIPVKNNNAKISFTKTLSDGDKLLIDSEKETIKFSDSSTGTFTNAIASMDSGSYFPNLDRNRSVLYNKVANAGIKLNYKKKWL